jgi:hypothetical protein
MMTLPMDFGISHDWNEESLAAKARWFQSLTVEQRMEVFCEMTELILENDPHIVERKDAEPIPGRVQVIELP